MLLRALTLLTLLGAVSASDASSTSATTGAWSIQLGRSNEEAGLRLFGWAIDSRAVARRGGVTCRSTRPGDGRLLLDVDDEASIDFNALGQAPRFVLLVEFFDEGTSPIRAVFESGEAVIRRKGAKRWLHADVPIERATFRNRIAGADLALDDGGQAAFIRRVELRLIPGDAPPPMATENQDSGSCAPNAVDHDAPSTSALATMRRQSALAALENAPSRAFWRERRLHVFFALFAPLIVACLATIDWRWLASGVRRRAYLPHAGAVLLFVAVSLTVTFPLCVSCGAGLHDLGDSILVTWIIDHGLQRLASDWRFFFDANTFYPSINTLALSEHMFSVALAAAPIIALTGNPILAHNALLLASFILGAFGLYWYVLYLMGRRDIALFSGLVYAFSSYRFSQLAHLQILSTELVPFCFYYLHRYLREGGGRFLLRFILVAVLQMLVCGYTAVFLTYALSFFGLVYLFVTGSWRRPRRLLFLGLAAMWVGVLNYPFVEPYLAEAAASDTRWTAKQVASLSAGLEHYLAPAASNWLYRDFAEAFTEGDPRLFPGAVALFLALLGALSCARPRSPSRGVLILDGLTALVAVALGFVVASGQLARSSGETAAATSTPQDLTICLFLLLGARVVWLLYGRRRSGGRPVQYAAAPAVMTFILAGCVLFSFGPDIRYEGSTWSNLFFRLVVDHVPGVAALRAPTRTALLGGFALAVLAGIGLGRLAPDRRRISERVRWKPTAFLTIVALAALAEHAGLPYMHDPPEASNARPSLEWYPKLGPDTPLIYQRVRSHPSVNALAELPMGHLEGDFRAMFYSTYHRRRLLNGYTGHMPPDHWELRAVLSGFPDAESLNRLHERRIGWVVLHGQSYSRRDWRRLRRRMAQWRDEVHVVAAVAQRSVLRAAAKNAPSDPFAHREDDYLLEVFPPPSGLSKYRRGDAPAPEPHGGRFDLWYEPENVAGEIAGFEEESGFYPLNFEQNDTTRRWSRGDAWFRLEERALDLADDGSTSSSLRAATTVTLSLGLPPPAPRGHGPHLRIYATRGEDAADLFETAPIRTIDTRISGMFEEELSVAPGDGPLWIGWAVRTVNLAAEGLSDDDRDLGLRINWVGVSGPAPSAPVAGQ